MIITIPLVGIFRNMTEKTSKTSQKGLNRILGRNQNLSSFSIIGKILVGCTLYHDKYLGYVIFADAFPATDLSYLIDYYPRLNSE